MIVMVILCLTKKENSNLNSQNYDNLLKIFHCIYYFLINSHLIFEFIEYNDLIKFINIDVTYEYLTKKLLKS